MNVFNIFIGLLFIGTSAVAQISPAEQNALKDMYRFTQGDSWTVTWDLASDAATWQGVIIVDNKVVGLDLSANNLEGELPSSLSDLIYLEHLDLSENSLSGELPDALGDLKNLETLALIGNELSGEVPETVFRLENIKKLQLADNAFEGLASTDNSDFNKF